MFESFVGKKVLITGHTGFKGSWLSLWLEALGAKVFGFSDVVPTSPSMFDCLSISYHGDFRGDVRDLKKFREVLALSNPDFIFHLAAQPLVMTSYQDPYDTFTTNAIGVLNLVELLREVHKPTTVVVITSDKVYDNVEWCWGYRETDRLGGKDPYSGSKAVCEVIVNSYLNSYFDKQNSFIKIVTVRAGNVIGGGDWSENRLVPDVIQSWNDGRIPTLRAPNSTRPWQHVLEPLSGYLMVAAKLACDHLGNEIGSFNFGPSESECLSVRELVDEMRACWPGAAYKIEEEQHGDKNLESKLLKLNCDKAWYHLRWKSVLCSDDMIKWTVNWYRSFYSKIDMRNLSLEQISDYQGRLNGVKI